MTVSTSLKSMSTKEGLVESNRHIRHGQYDETSAEDEKRRLTLLGRKQPELTGLRLSILARGGLDWAASSRNDISWTLKAIQFLLVIRRAPKRLLPSLQVSHLPRATCMKPDPLLNEALPSPMMIPTRPNVPNAEKEI